MVPGAIEQSWAHVSAGSTLSSERASIKINQTEIYQNLEWAAAPEQNILGF